MLIPSGRVMLSANLIGDANAHHQVRHRARHGLRGGVASPLQRFAPVVPVSGVAGPHAAPAPRQRLPQAGCRVSPSPDGLPWCRASGFASREARPLPVFNKLPSASFQQQQSRASGQLNLSAIGGHPSHSQTNISSLHAAIRRPAQHVRRSRRLGGGGNRASVFASGFAETRRTGSSALGN